MREREKERETIHLFDMSHDLDISVLLLIYL